MRFVAYILPIIATFAAALALSGCAHTPRLPEPNVLELHADMAYLSSPEMAGREPGAQSEMAVSGFLIDRMEQAGLAPAFIKQSDAQYGGWSQPVTLFKRLPQKAEIQFRRNGKILTQPQGRLRVIGVMPNVTISDAPILFLGRGSVDAALRNDLKGAIVLLHAAPNEADRAEREAALALAGALGVIELVRGGDAFAALNREIDHFHFFRPTLAMDPINGLNRTSFSAIMGEERAVSLVTQSGVDWDKMLLRSTLPGYTGDWLKARADISVDTHIEKIQSQNIGGVIKGRKPNSGAVLFIAHWDHLGHCVRRSGLPDIICPGAVDNASGIAAMLQIAEALAEKSHDRDIYFVATTGEEHGFVGANTLLANLPFAKDDMVAVFNLDMLAIAPAGTPVSVIGWEGGPFDQAILQVITEQGLKRSDNPMADSFLKRQDGWVFVQSGHPARMVNSSYGDEWALNAFLSNGYHSPSDRYSPNIEIGGALQDIRLHIALGHHFANMETYPDTSKGAN